MYVKDKIGAHMKTRTKPRGNGNAIGANVETLRKAKGYTQKEFIAKMQSNGVDINPTSYSKLEGQSRYASDREVYIISRLLGVQMEELFTETV